MPCQRGTRCGTRSQSAVSVGERAMVVSCNDVGGDERNANATVPQPCVHGGNGCLSAEQKESCADAPHRQVSSGNGRRILIERSSGVGACPDCADHRGVKQHGACSGEESGSPEAYAAARTLVDTDGHRSPACGVDGAVASGLVASHEFGITGQ